MDASREGSGAAAGDLAAAGRSDAAHAAEAEIGGSRADAERAAGGHAAAGPTAGGQAAATQAAGSPADVERPAAGQTDPGPAAISQAGADKATANHAPAEPTPAVHAAATQPAGVEPPAAGQTDPGPAAGSPAGAGQAAAAQVAGGWAALGQVPGHGQGGGWGPVETLGGGVPGYPVHPAAPPSRRGRRLRMGAAVAVVAAVLASIGVGVYALTDDDGGRSTATSQQQGGRDDERGAPDEGGPEREGDGEGDEPRRVESGAVTDSLSGISLPVPEGWYGEELQVGAALTSKESYDCPGDTSKTCVKGGAYSAPAVVLGTRGGTAEEVAKADIAANAEESYGGEAYGRITSHDVLASKAVTVAGQKGYLVRWRAVTQEGSDGFVQSLAFPSPSRPDQIVVVRFGVDTDQRQTVLDEITEGIEVAEGGRGSGQDV
ncbi:hypothetical protein ACFW5X_19600 [Streptomyces albogriseolus]|uniref:hypothetical protein n=1 Tax=Streptomyces albogriseolus TaxID=1887 RepID=UPI003697E6A7